MIINKIYKNINILKNHKILLGEKMEKFIYSQDLILSEKHLNLILEKFLSKKLYENNLITFDIYEKIKEEIDCNISEINLEFKKLLTDKKIKIQTNNEEL